MPILNWRSRARDRRLSRTARLLALVALLTPLVTLGAAAPASAVCRTEVYDTGIETPWYPCPDPQDQPIGVPGVIVMQHAVGECCWSPMQFWKIEKGTHAYFAHLDPYQYPEGPADGSARRYISEFVGSPAIADTGMVPLGGVAKFVGIEDLDVGTYYVQSEVDRSIGTLVITESSIKVGGCPPC